MDGRAGFGCVRKLVSLRELELGYGADVPIMDFRGTRVGPLILSGCAFTREKTSDGRAILDGPAVA
jgi:hypothetical protein